MRLKQSTLSANEELVRLTTNGYELLSAIRADYAQKKAANSYSEQVDLKDYEQKITGWLNTGVEKLRGIFPTDLEAHTFVNPDIPLGTVGGDYRYESLMRNFKYYISGLDRIRKERLPEYTDLPINMRLYVEDIDSFHKVRDVNPHMVNTSLKDGFLNRSEDNVQLALERILGVSFHRKDWAGELNDLFTANVIVNGMRRATAFLLKGPGIGKKEMTIADCGDNGDQIVRLFTTPADLFVVQYVGPIADLLIKDVEGKVTELQSKGKDVRFLIIDGQDTARLLHAYGKL